MLLRDLSVVTQKLGIDWSCTRHHRSGNYQSISWPNRPHNTGHLLTPQFCQLREGLAAAGVFYRNPDGHAHCPCLPIATIMSAFACQTIACRLQGNGKKKSRVKSLGYTREAPQLGKLIAARVAQVIRYSCTGNKVNDRKK